MVKNSTVKVEYRRWLKKACVCRAPKNVVKKLIPEHHMFSQSDTHVHVYVLSSKY